MYPKLCIVLITISISGQTSRFCVLCCLYTLRQIILVCHTLTSLQHHRAALLPGIVQQCSGSVQSTSPSYVAHPPFWFVILVNIPQEGIEFVNSETPTISNSKASKLSIICVVKWLVIYHSNEVIHINLIFWGFDLHGRSLCQVRNSVAFSRASCTLLCYLITFQIDSYILFFYINIIYI